jgi:hypothetical protein
MDHGSLLQGQLYLFFFFFFKFCLFKFQIAIAKLKMYESPGSDQILAELNQAGGKTLWSKILKLINSIGHNEELPDQWKESIITPV